MVVLNVYYLVFSTSAFFLLVKVDFLFLCCKDTAIMAKEKGIFPK